MTESPHDELLLALVRKMARKAAYCALEGYADDRLTFARLNELADDVAATFDSDDIRTSPEAQKVRRELERVRHHAYMDGVEFAAGKAAQRAARSSTPEPQQHVRECRWPECSCYYFQRPGECKAQPATGDSTAQPQEERAGPGVADVERAYAEIDAACRLRPVLSDEEARGLISEMILWSNYPEGCSCKCEQCNESVEAYTKAYDALLRALTGRNA